MLRFCPRCRCVSMVTDWLLPRVTMIDIAGDGRAISTCSWNRSPRAIPEAGPGDAAAALAPMCRKYVLLSSAVKVAGEVKLVTVALTAEMSDDVGFRCCPAGYRSLCSGCVRSCRLSGFFRFHPMSQGSRRMARLRPQPAAKPRKRTRCSSSRLWHARMKSRRSSSSVYGNSFGRGDAYGSSSVSQ